MTISTLPTAAAIRIESRLRPEQVNLTYADTTALETDITARITKYRPVIEKRLSGVDSSDDNQIVATEALFKRVEASLYGSAGYLNPAYWERAKELKAESEELINLLQGEGEEADTGDTSARSFVRTLTRATDCEPEYSRTC